MLRCWDSESIGLDFSPMKSSLFSVLASLIHTRWTEDLSCGFIKVALLFTEQHSGQQANMAYVKIWWYFFSILRQINKVLMENYFCVVCVGQLKKKSQKSSKKAPLWLSTNNFSSWNFKMWSTGNVKGKFYRHKKHLPALDGMTFGKLLSQFNKQIRKFKQLENLGNGVSPALTVLSQEKLLKQRNFIFKCSISTFLFRHKFWFFPPSLADLDFT